MPDDDKILSLSEVQSEESAAFKILRGGGWYLEDIVGETKQRLYAIKNANTLKQF